MMVREVSGQKTRGVREQCLVQSVCVHLAEIWFSILERRCLRRADFPNPDALERAIRAFIATYNRLHAHPFR